MRITIPKKALAGLLGKVSGAAAEPKSAVPALTHVLLTATAGSDALDAGTLTAAATDLYRSALVSSPADVAEPGRVALPVRELDERVRSMGDGPITIETEEVSCIIRSANGKRRFSLPMLDADIFPPLPSPSDVHTPARMPASALALLISRTHFAVCTDESRAHVNGALLGWRGGVARMASTDSHRLCSAEATVTIDGEHAMIVPLRALTEVRKLVEGAAEEASVIITPGDPWIHLEIDGLRFGFKVAAGPEAFPPYEQVIPSRDSMRQARVNRLALIDALRAVSVASEERTGGIKLTAAEGVLRIATESAAKGSGADEVAADYEGREVTTGLNASYVIAALACLDCDEVEIGVREPLDPITVRPVGVGGYVGVVMPVRT
jgi:DNA polymerase-3 subunit beta